MKKYIALLSACCLSFCLCGCEEEGKPEDMPQQFYDTCVAFCETVDDVVVGDITCEEAEMKFKRQEEVFKIYEKKKDNYSGDTYYLAISCVHKANFAQIDVGLGDFSEKEIENLIEYRDDIAERINLD